MIVRFERILRLNNRSREGKSQIIETLSKAGIRYRSA